MSDHKDYTEWRIRFWDKVWRKTGNRVLTGSYYHRRLARVFDLNIPADASVLEVGCGNGKLLGAITCKAKTGIDFSSEAIRLAKSNYPEDTFIEISAMDFTSQEKYDYIILSDLLGDVWDIQILLEKIHSWSHGNTKIIVNFYSKLWEGVLKLLQFLRLKKPTLEQNWLTRSDLNSVSYLSNFETVKTWQEVLIPVRIPLFNWLINLVLVKVWFFPAFGFIKFYDPESNKKGTKRI